MESVVVLRSNRVVVTSHHKNPLIDLPIITYNNGFENCYCSSRTWKLH